MNRTELVAVIAQATNESPAVVGRFLTCFLDQVQAAVAQGREVKLSGFGKFDRAAAAARTGRNLRTRQAVSIPPTVRPRFIAGSDFKKAVRER